ncbi:MAG: alkaline phosphatase family protein [Candidatus Tectomicrobia bacterium]|nr:alkaline phosphatase family protein [Candidatus Tectomicrobia bacterium]
MPKILLIFIDGLGLGINDALINPCAKAKADILGNFLDPATSTITRNNGPLPFDGFIVGVDASLGVKGLPQSGTGQTALLTGMNAAEIAGRHVPAFPTKKLREVIYEHSLFKTLVTLGKKVALLNAYRPAFFELGEKIWEKRLSASAFANHAARLPFFTFDHVTKGEALHHEFTNALLREAGFDLPLYTPSQAGKIAAQRSEVFDFLMFEYFQTDFAGHSKEMEKGVQEIEKLDGFLTSLLSSIDLNSTLVILASDHGNIEDLSVKTHTLNRAMTICWGQEAEAVASRLKMLTDLAPAVVEYLIS